MKMDQFIEEIQYEEARAYEEGAGRLLTIDGCEGAGQWIGQAINRKYGADPDF